MSLNENDLKKLLFDGENYFLIRSLNEEDIRNIDGSNGISPRDYSDGKYSVRDVLLHSNASFNSNFKFISMTTDPNVVLTYNRDDLNRFVLIKLSKDEALAQNKMFSAGDYLLSEMERKIQESLKTAPEDKKEQIQRKFEDIDKATSVEAIKQIINGVEANLSTSLIDSEQQYLSESERMLQAKEIAKCKVLNYYGIMKKLDESLKHLGSIEAYTGTMRVAYHNSEWLTAEKIKQEKIIDIPRITLDALALIKQAEFQGKDAEQLKKLEQGVLKSILNPEETISESEQILYSQWGKLREELTIDKAFKMTGGQISYRDTNMQMVAIRALAEMTLYKRKIVELLQGQFPEVNVSELLAGTYCVNREMTTRQNKKGIQIGKNINFEISDYGYSFNEDISNQIFQSVDGLSNEELENIISQGVNAEETQKLLIVTRESNQRIHQQEIYNRTTKYIAEAIVEGYNWKKTRGALTSEEKIKLINRISLNARKDKLKRLYNNLEKIEIDGRKLLQQEIFAVIINIAIDKELGEKKYSDILNLSEEEQKSFLEENKNSFQTLVSAISLDLLMNRGKTIKKLKNSLIDLGISEELLEEKYIKNIYTAKKIVDEYFKDYKKGDGTEVTNEEKKVIIEQLLSNKALNKDRTVYLSTLIEKLKNTGLEEKEQYGFIIRLAVGENNGIGSYSAWIMGKVKLPGNIEKLKENSKVTDKTIEKALINNDIIPKRLQKRLDELKISQEIIEEKDLINIDTAIEIVDEYFKDYKKRDGTEVTDEEKKVIIEQILNNSYLNKNKKKLTALIKKLKNVGLKEKEQCGFIIRLAIEKNTGIGSYSDWINSTAKLSENIKELKEKSEVTAETIENAFMNNNKIPKRLHKRLNELEISQEVIEEKDIENIDIAIEIVDEYFKDYKKRDGTEVTNKEKKVIIEQVLSNKVLNKDRAVYLSTLIEKLKNAGLEEKEQYGFIIRLAIEKNTGVGSYDDLIHGSAKLPKKIEVLKDKCEVTDKTIEKALINNDIIPKRLQERLDELEISQEIIEEKAIRNIDIAIEIVDEYFKDYKKRDEAEVTNEEKKVIIEQILSNICLNKDKSYYLSVLIEKLKNAGLEEKEQYGFIIRLAVGENTGIGSYSAWIMGTAKLPEHIEELKEKSKVTDKTIKNAFMNNDIIPKRLQVRLDELEISQEIIEEKAIRNIDTAVEIVDEYFKDYKKRDGTEVTNKEKKVIIDQILINSHLNKNRTRYLSVLIEKLKNAGLEEKEQYGFIIRLSIEKNTGIGSYTKWIDGEAEVPENIEVLKDKCKVTDKTIQKAKQKAERLMKKAIKQKKDKGELSEIEQTFVELQKLQGTEKSQSDNSLSEMGKK